MSAPPLEPGMSQQPPKPPRNPALTGLLIGGNLMVSVAILAVLGVFAYVLFTSQGASAEAGSEETPETAAITPSPSPTGMQYGITLGGGDEEIYPPPPPPAPLQQGTPGTPVDAGKVTVTVVDNGFHPEQPTDAGPSQCITVEITSKSNEGDANAAMFWLTSSTHQGVRSRPMIVPGQLIPEILQEGESTSGFVCFPDEVMGQGEKILTFTNDDEDVVEHNVQWRLP
ncbi:hypothetical protein [Dermabacter vaginalis]|nr:hypothetical protein [Dermabacter vaginalis]